MLPAFLIALREGLEGALIVVILATYLVRVGRKSELKAVWLGVAAAVAGSLITGIIVTAGVARLPEWAQEAFTGIATTLAVAVLTWMIFWMRHHARGLKSSLESRTESAMESGQSLALPVLAFTSVGREGLETVLFLRAAVASSTAHLASRAGATLGLLVAAGIAYGIYKGGVKLNLRSFFQVTGGLIIVVSAGLLSGAIQAFNEAGWFNVLTQRAWDLSSLVSTHSIVGSALNGLFGYEPKPSVFQVIAYWAFLVPAVFGFYFWPVIRARRAKSLATNSVG
ncbi:MAG: iron uptake transporter permease EfeU [Actinomycetota bacterium]|nr:FTR1 family protein [Actinomycetota bacterium]